MTVKTYSLEEYEHIEGMKNKFPQFNENQWRWIIANKKRYGLEAAIKRIGKRIYFHLPSIAKWVSEQDA